MELKITPFIDFGMPDVPIPTTSIFEHLGEEGVRKLISDQYEIIRHSEIGHLFPKNDEAFEQAKQHSANFFIQRFGGPNYYEISRGNPMLKKRHAPFKITEEGRKIWLGAYQQLLPKLDIPEDVVLEFWKFLDVFSIWMVNSKDEGC